jgi:hypothetical protein
MANYPAVGTVDAEAFSESCRAFLATLEDVTKRQLQRDRNEVFRERLLPLLDRVFGSLQSEVNIASLKAAVDAELEDETMEETLSLLQEEMDFYVAWQGPGIAVEENAAWGGSVDQKNFDSQPTAETDNLNAIKVGQTIKDSLEGLIKRLPRKLTKGLKVLNELLSIVGIGS